MRSAMQVVHFSGLYKYISNVKRLVRYLTQYAGK